MFMFDETNPGTGWSPKNPQLQKLGCGIFGVGMFFAILLLVLALWFPRAWLGVAACAVPLLVLVSPLVWMVLHLRGR